MSGPDSLVCVGPLMTFPIKSPAEPPVKASASSRPEDRFPAAFAHVNHIEGGDRAGGGFNEIKGDHGGATKFGCSLRFLAGECALAPDLLAKFDIDHNGDIDGADVRGLTQDGVKALFRRKFWDEPGIGLLSAPFDAAVYDQAVNCSVKAAVTLLQRALNAVFRTTFGLEPLRVDGALGPGTRGRLAMALQQGKGEQTLAALRAEAELRYVRIAAADPTQAKFLKGWRNRARGLGDV